MASSNEAAFWDSKYAVGSFFYGKEPNAFVRYCASKYLTPGSECVDLASGEGRNTAHLAQLGHHVTAVDFSTAGLDKTRQLAAETGCADRVTCVQADILQWRPEVDASVDAAVMSFCHVQASQKQMLLDNVAHMLKTGGML
mmetsp:Transcript_9621/g.20506  ORF Transcript_9621/g.20506 Transcript_9621/m.20506 type:complete len:141 (-) Transcript_9621:361-783(-)